jgi:hypothetical protein
MDAFSLDDRLAASPTINASGQTFTTGHERRATPGQADGGHQPIRPSMPEGSVGHATFAQEAALRL